MHIQTENHARVPFEIGERDVDARLYASASEKYPTREQREAAELAECTFKPKINKLAESRSAEIKLRAAESVGTEDVGTGSERRTRLNVARRIRKRRMRRDAPRGRFRTPRRGGGRARPRGNRETRRAGNRRRRRPARLFVAPPGYDETVQRMRAAKEARETRGETSVLDSRAAWIDPRGAADGKKKRRRRRR